MMSDLDCWSKLDGTDSRMLLHGGGDTAPEAGSKYTTGLPVFPYIGNAERKNGDCTEKNKTISDFFILSRFDMMDYMVLPCGSVLEWVNEFLTVPISKEDYTVGIWGFSIVVLLRMMRGVEKQVTLKAFGINDPVTNIGKDSMPYQHTHFSNPEIRFWREEFWNVPASVPKKP